MNQPVDEQKPEINTSTLTNSFQKAIEAFQRNEISLPKAIIVAAVIIAIGILLS